jgi:hypothetical protein
MRSIYGIYAVVMLLLVPSISRGDSSGWKRSATKSPSDLYLFHSTHAINLPTAETLNKGMLEIEISHRFVPPVSEGIEALYGFDGPVNMRIAVGYSLTDRAILTLGRSNVFDNIDFNIKYKLAQFHSNSFPILLAVQGGVGWNSAKFDGRSRGDARNFQYYGQLIANSLIAKKLGIGLVPSYLYNSDIFSPNYDKVFAVGSYVQYYFSSLLSFLAEWNIGVSGDYKPDNAVSFGIELETGGHFFKIILTNSVLLNSSQFLPGTEYPFRSKEWRLGFLITRLMKT